MSTFRALLGMIGLATSLAGECDRSPLLIQNASVWAGYRLEPNRDVLFRDGRVAQVGRKLRVPAATRIIDATGDTLLPGLLDLHLHFVIPGLPAGVRDYEVSGRQLLRYGVTGGRLHLASIAQAVELERAGREDCAAMPRIQAGGPGLSGGTPDVDSPAFRGVRGPDDARAKIERIAEAGLQWLPLHDLHKFSEPERQAIQSAAAQHKLRIFSSATSAEELRESLRQKVDTIDYIDRSHHPTYAADILQLLRAHRRRVAAVPTVGIFKWYELVRTGSASLDEPYLYEFLSPEAAEQVRARAKRDMATNEYVISSSKFATTLPRKLRDLMRTGVPVAIGTDVGSPAQLHPGAVWREMEAWREAGLPHDVVLRAATSIPAAVLRDPDVGHLRPGARADFVLYRGLVTRGKFDASRVRAVGKAGALLVNESRWVGP